MEPKTVGMLSSYSGLNQADWLWKQSPHCFGRWGNIQVWATDSQPDYLLLYQFDFYRVLQSRSQPRAQSLLEWCNRFLPYPSKAAEPSLPKQFSHVPKDRTLFLLREPPLPEVWSQNLSNYDYAQRFCGYVSGPDDDAPIPDYMPAIWYVNLPFQYLRDAPPPEKVRACSWVTSGIQRTANHRKRIAFMKVLENSDIGVDLYGRDLPTWAQSLGTLSNKWSGLAPYYYTLALENYADNSWYVSEKLWDALLSWCLPIYYGGSAADRLLPPGSFLRLASLDDQGIQQIRETIATPDAWHQAKAAISEARQVILHKLNLLNWLDEKIKDRG